MSSQRKLESRILCRTHVTYIDYIKKHSILGNFNLDQLIEECAAQKAEKLFQPAKNELMQNIKTNLIRLFEDKNEADRLMGMDKKILSKEIGNLLQSVAKSS